MLGRRDLDVRRAGEAPPEDRLHERWLPWAAAGPTAWQFPLRQPGLTSASRVVDGWDRFHGGRGLLDLEARLVRQPHNVAARGHRDQRAGDDRGGDAADG